MGLFGGLGRPNILPPSVQQRPLQMPLPAEAAPAPPKRRGLFGGGITPDRLMIMGAALQDAGNGGDTNNAAQMWAMQQQRDRGIRQDKLDDETAQAERADRQYEQQQRTQRQQMIEQYIASLPPERQAQARVAAALDPEGFVERLQGGEWQVGQGYTHAFRPRPDGSIERGGELPLRPYAPRSSSSTQSYTGLPPGFDLD